MILFLLDRERFLNNASINIIDLVVIAAFFAVAGIAVIKFSSRVNFTWSVTLPKAVEFSSALRKLRVLDLKKQIAFVREHKLAVFIAAAPILGDDKENVRAKFYPFVNNILASESVFTSNIGKRTLCLDAEEYEHLAEELKRRSIEEDSIVVAGKNEEIKNLRAAVASLTQENADQSKELNELRGKVQIQPAQEKDRVDRLRMERLQWAVLTPIIERFIAEPKKDGKYTTPDIEAAFAAAWREREDLRAAMLHLTGDEETKPSEALIAAVKAELKDAGLFSSGGRPKKNP